MIDEPDDDPERGCFFIMFYLIICGLVVSGGLGYLLVSWIAGSTCANG